VTAKALLSSAWQHWTTPEDVLHRVGCIEPICLDPCGNANDRVHAAESWWGPGADVPGEHSCDGLKERWLRPGRGLIYCNPPFGRELAAWVRKAAAEGDAGAEIVLLVPARTDTVWWHEHIAGVASARCYWKGRLRFGNPPPDKGGGDVAPFPACVVYHGPRPYAFGAAFEDAGEIVIG
jgi:hypothetical protein